MNGKDFSKTILIREGDDNAGKALNKLKKIIEDKYNVKIGNRFEFHKWSVEHLAEFWGEFWEFTGMVCSKKYDQVIDLNVPMSESPEWFKGAKLNMAENLLRYKDDRLALISASEDNDAQILTYAQLNEQVRRYAAAFRKFGLKKRDFVTCYMSSRSEAVIVMNAVISIGAIWIGTMPLLGSKAVLNRFRLVKPRVIITVDRFKYNGEEIEMLEKVKEIVENSSFIEKVIIVPTRPESRLKDIKGIRNSCFLDEFLETGRNEDGSYPPLTFEQVSFSHPVFLNFTSGSTGPPKLVLHGCGAILPTPKDFWLHLDSDRDSLWFCSSTIGWVTWNMTVTLSFCGIPFFLFEGVPFYINRTYFWDLIDRFNVTHVFLASSVLDELERKGCVPSTENHLRSLKVILAGGSFVKPDNFDFVYNKIKKDIVFSPSYGCTEIIGTLWKADSAVAVYRGEIPMRCLGVDVKCVDETGQEVKGTIGCTVIVKPCPFLPVGLWPDTDGSQFKKNYFESFPGYFSINDLAVINPVTKGIVVLGRSDNILKQRGIRFGSSEIYDIVSNFKEVKDSVCTSQYNKEMEERTVLFLKMTDGRSLDEDLTQKIRDAIAELSPSHVPEVITEVPDIPYSYNGKKCEILVKNIINKRPINIETISNLDCLKYYENHPDIKEF